ncbi:MAG: sigma-54 interaction domain-containing protein [Vicinamibacterales bacterium]
MSADRTAPPISESPAMRALMINVERAAASPAKVLITGESGVGKDVIAREIHRLSPRAERPFVALNCAGLPESLLESELFGHTRGSFTGAYRDKPGKLQLAHRGTLFLDEVGDMSLRMQALLLRFLESGELQVIGGDALSTRTDVRVIAATHRDLTQRVREGQFREDLLYRLRVIHLRMPPLRDRVEDIAPLVQHYIAMRGLSAFFTDEALALMRRYHWPGNIRELQNVVEQAAWMSGSSVIDVEHVAPCFETTVNRVTRERRRQKADDLHEGLISRATSFWGDIHPMFLARDLTRHDLRQLVHRGLTTTGGNYRALLRLYGIPDEDYKRFLNFLAAHDCGVDVRNYRDQTAPAPSTQPLVPVNAHTRPNEERELV